MTNGNMYPPDGRLIERIVMVSNDFTIRDYFAAAALPLAYQAYEKSESVPVDMQAGEFIAGVAYEIADACLKEREK